MAKKINSTKNKKNLRRTSTMARAVSEGEQFLAQTQKKKTPRTRSMDETIKEAQSLIQKKKLLTKKKIVNKSAAQKSKANNKPVTKKSAATSKASLNDKQKQQQKKPDQNVVKKTIFKTKSKENLPIPAYGFIDVCFCLDATGSMSSELAQVQSTIQSIINNVSGKVRTQGLTLRFAIVTYRDHPPQDSSYVTKHLDFTDGYEAGEYVKKLQAFGGGDFPEAVHDGLIQSCTALNWVNLGGVPVLRYIFHIADAPPHGKEFGNIFEKQGCLCGLTTSQIYEEINKKQTHYRLIKCRQNAQLNDMQKKFKGNIHDFDSTTLSLAKQMNVKVSDMIINEIIPDY